MSEQRSPAVKMPATDAPMSEAPAPKTPVPKPSTPAAPTPEAALPRLLLDGDRSRKRTIKLEWPVEYDGRRYDEIVVRRMIGAEVTRLSDLIVAEFDDSDLFALVCDTPAVVIRALDQDDWLAVREAVLSFLPRRFREVFASTGAKPEA